MKVLTTLAAAVLVASSGGAGVIAAAGATKAGSSSVTTPPVAATALAFARQVVSSAPLPNGSEPVHLVPSLLSRPFQTAGDSGLIDLDRIYSVTESVDALRAYVRAHLPPSAVISATGTFGGPAGSGSGLVVSLRTSGPNEYLAELVYSFVASGTGSVFRIDAQSVWVPDRPASETVPRDAIATLTGYATLSAARPSSGAASVRLNGIESDRLVVALDALAVSPKPDCMEDSLEYQFVVRVGRDGPRYQVLGLACESTVEMSLNGRQLLALSDTDCSVMKLVGQFVPLRAIATRRVAMECRET